MRLYGRWNVTLPGEQYVWEPDEVTLSEQLMIEREAGTSYDEWIRNGVADDLAIPCQVLVWFLRYKNGRQEDRMGVDFPIRKLELTEIEDDPNPEASAASEAATSETSPSPTTSGPGNGGLSLAKTS